VSETKLNPTIDLNRVKIEGYSLITTHSKTAFGGSGVYVSDHLKFHRRTDLELDMDDCESCFIEIKTTSNQKDLIVGSIYRHPHFDNFETFTSQLINSVQKVNKSKKYKLLLAGDFNINTASNDRQAKNYKDTVCSLGLANVISKPTRVTTSSETTIDHILTNIQLQKVSSGVVKYDVSDHLPIFAICNLNIDKKDQNSNVFYRPVHDSKKDKFVENFLGVYTSLPNVISDITDPDCDLSNLMDAISLAFTKTFPNLKRGKKKIKGEENKIEFSHSLPLSQFTQP